METTGLRFGPIAGPVAHVCVDMQRLFTAAGPWPVPWIEKIMPTVFEVSRHMMAETIFTRFIPPQEPGQVPGMWRNFYRRWGEVTRENLDPELLELLAPLKKMSPPAHVCDRWTYSAFGAPELIRSLRGRGVTTVILTGGETDVCVLATVLSAIDAGYRVILVADALCSTSDASHDAVLGMFTARYSQQVETVSTDQLVPAVCLSRGSL
jgi:nicotinamidase-related amidase